MFYIFFNIDGVQPRVETIDETAKGNKLLRERSTLSRECTSLSRDGTLTSLKKQGSNLSGKKVGKIDDGADKTKEEKPFLVTKLSILVILEPFVVTLSKARLSILYKKKDLAFILEKAGDLSVVTSFKADEKAVLIRYNRIPHPIPDTKRERNTNN